MKAGFLFLLFAALVLNGQTYKGDFSVLRHNPRLCLEVDFADAEIHGMSEDDFADYETDWDKDMPEIIGIIISSCNEKTRGAVVLGRDKSLPYTLRLKVRSINTRGDFDCDAYLLDKDGNEEGAILGLWGRGGRIGSKLNLIKDGAHSIGRNLGYALQEAIRRSPKTYSI